jgi:hypothetical protein
MNRLDVPVTPELTAKMALAGCTLSGEWLDDG